MASRHVLGQESNLVSLSLTSNPNLRGPFGACFYTMNRPAQHVLVLNNSQSAPFCRAGTRFHKLAQVLPRCSDLQQAVEVRCVLGCPNCVLSARLQ